MSQRLLAAALVCVVALGAGESDRAAATTAAEPSYTVVDLGGVDSRAMAINSSGAIAGEQRESSGYGRRAFRWLNGEKTVQGASDARAQAINASGDMVGTTDVCEQGYCPRATLWIDNVATDLGALGGGASFATGINDAREVVGYFATATGETYGGQPTLHPFIWKDGTMRDLGTLGGALGFAEDVNNHGEVVGFAHSACPVPGTPECDGGPYHAFLWTPTPGGLGTMSDLGTFPGTEPGTRLSYARAINDRGQIVGAADVVDGLLTRRRAFLWEKGRWRDLGSLAPGGRAEALAINESAQVVGTALRADGALAAFLWQNGVLTDLNSLIAAGSGWRLAYAHGINDAGRIVGFGKRDGSSEWRAFLLVPRVRLVALTVDRQRVPGGAVVVGRVTLSQQAPPGGATVAVSTTFATPEPVASVPQFVTVSAGAITRQFAITTRAVKATQSGLIRATYAGVNRGTRLTVRPIGVERVATPASAGVDLVAGVLVRLELPAAPGSITVRLSSSNPTVAIPVASHVTFAAGVAVRTVGVKTLAPGQATITAVANGVGDTAILHVTG